MGERNIMVVVIIPINWDVSRKYTPKEASNHDKPKMNMINGRIISGNSNAVRCGMPNIII